MKYHKQVDVSSTQETSRGRVESRTCLATSDIDWLEEKEKWKGLKSVVAIESKRTTIGRTTIEKRHYISSLEANSNELNRIIQAHWGVENSLHWILDIGYWMSYSEKMRVELGPAMLRKIWRL